MFIKYVNNEELKKLETIYTMYKSQAPNYSSAALGRLTTLPERVVTIGCSVSVGVLEVASAGWGSAAVGGLGA